MSNSSSSHGSSKHLLTTGGAPSGGQRVRSKGNARVSVDEAISASWIKACKTGDIDACHLSLLKLQQAHPESVEDLIQRPSMPDSCFHPLYDLLGHGLALAATQGHAVLVEFLFSCQYAELFQHGVCQGPTWFPPFEALRTRELPVCAQSLRYVAYAALACVEATATRGLFVLLEMDILWAFEAEWCLLLAIRKALSTFRSMSDAPTGFHAMIVGLVLRHHDLLHVVRDFHTQLPPGDHQEVELALALEQSLLYDIELNRPVP